jgi:hypothetical protein
VEAGQLTIIALAFAAVAYWRANQLAYRRFIVQPASLAIALAGLYWTIQRALFLKTTITFSYVARAFQARVSAALKGPPSVLKLKCQMTRPAPLG